MTQLEKFLNTLESKTNVKIIQDFDWDDFKVLSPLEKYKTYKNVYKLKFHYRKDDEKLICGLSHQSIQRTGLKYYPKSIWVTSLIITKKEIKINNFDQDLFNFFLENANLKVWDKDKNFLSEHMRLLKPTIFKDFILGKVYNEETYYKSIAHRMYNLKNISWRDFKNVYKFSNVLINDLKDCTVNFENSLRVLANAEDWGYRTLLADCVNSAVQLGEKIDFNWSKKRLQAEHTRQIRELMKQELEQKAVEQIYDKVVEEKGFKLLNTEYDIFCEGQMMNHCLYTCYYQRIKNKEYIAYHITGPEDCTLGIRLGANGAVLDQIYQKYDRCVSEETKNLALDFIKKHAEELTQMFSEKVTNKCLENEYALPW